MKLLLHSCCAPCTIMCLEALRRDAVEPTIYWYNPNIHPYTEYRLRRDALKDFCLRHACALEMEDTYGLKNFLAETVAEDPSCSFSFGQRCVVCYRMRLDATARFAAEHGYDTFTTTLLYSPYQNRQAILSLGQKAAESWGVSFLPADFRSYFKEGQARALEEGIYLQKYCGCIFSEEERFSSRARKALRRSQESAGKYGNLQGGTL